MQVEQKNIWEDVTRNAKRDNSNRAIDGLSGKYAGCRSG